MLNNPRMKTCKEIRHQNLLTLIEKSGTIQAFADKLGKSHAQISQIKNKSANSSTGKVRGIGDEQAREIEKKLDLEIGWMDHDHSDTHVSDLLPMVKNGEAVYNEEELKYKKIENLINVLFEKPKEELDELLAIIYAIDKFRNR